MPRDLLYFICGLVVGILIGFFGVGGSSIATPMLSIAGVQPFFAIASPLPGTIPSALVAVIPYIKRKQQRSKTAVWTLIGTIPGATIGALESNLVGGKLILLFSGGVLVLIGLRLLVPITEAGKQAGIKRRRNRVLLVFVSLLVGFISGMLANGGGFLLVPIYILIFGLDMRQAAGTSLIVIAVLTVPILLIHALLGHINWNVALFFALGSVPTSFLVSEVTKNINKKILQKIFAGFLIASGIGFVLFRLIP